MAKKLFQNQSLPTPETASSCKILSSTIINESQLIQCSRSYYVFQGRVTLFFADKF